MGFIKSQLKGDGYIWAIFFAFALVSMVCAYSSNSFFAFRSEVFYAPIMGHITHLFMGFLIMIIASNIPVHVYRNTSWFAVLIAVGTLIAVQFEPSSSGGANRSIGSFQPSEVGKYASVTICAMFLHRGQKDGVLDVEVEKLIRAIVFPAGIALLIFFDNLSTAVLLALTIVTMVYLSGIPKKVFMKYLMTPAIGLVIIGYLGVMYLPDKLVFADRIYTWRARIERIGSDDNPYITQEIGDKNRQVIFGHMAVARGGVFGNPFKSQMRDFLPLAFSDFIYSIIIEEWGLVGGILVLFLYLSLLVRVFIIFNRCTKVYDRLLMLGLTVSIVLQACLNMAVGVNLGPVTGQPLPLISFGGSSIIMTCFYFGIIQSVSSRVGFGEKGLGEDWYIDTFIGKKAESREEDEDYGDDEENTDDQTESEMIAAEEEKEVLSQNTSLVEESIEARSEDEEKELEEEKEHFYPF